jgi:hypothetical protein
VAKIRDQQRSKVYRAEDILGRTKIGDGSVSAVQEYVDAVMTSAVVRRNYPDAPKRVPVRDGRGRRRAAALERGTVITLPAGWARTKEVVLHELAHVINAHDKLREKRERVEAFTAYAKSIGLHYWHRSLTTKRHAAEKVPARAAHGWQFAAILLDLVQWELGIEFRRQLAESFKKNGVRYRAPREIDDAERERLRQLAARNFGAAARSRQASIETAIVEAINATGAFASVTTYDPPAVEPAAFVISSGSMAWPKDGDGAEADRWNREQLDANAAAWLSLIDREAQR